MILALLLGCPAPHQSTTIGSTACKQIARRSHAGGTSAAAALARRLGRSEHLLIGLGNDLEGRPPEQGNIHTLPAALDIHYAYLTGLPGENSWTAWNPDATFVDRFVASAVDSCMLPMFTLYAMADRGEDNMMVLSNTSYMRRWWSGLDLLLTRLAATNTPALLHIEPDFWGFAQQHTGGDPSALRVVLPEDCADLDGNLIGMSACLRRRISRAPQVAYGLHASTWAGTAAQTAAFMNAIDPGDLLFVETLDRDAGCFEAGRSPHCQRNDGPWYWSDADFSAHLRWAGALSTQTGKPLLWWQMPLGRPRAVSGREEGYRDNRVRYVFSHPEAFVAAGGVGVVFGRGAPGQTSVRTDGGQFASATRSYYEAPAALP